MAEYDGSVGWFFPVQEFPDEPRLIRDPAELAGLWRDRTATYLLRGAAGLEKAGLGGHLRRSFLGALARGASPQAREGRPCPWDPPCAFDLFCREQMRTPQGEGLPKPYLIFMEAAGKDLRVSVRVFGRAAMWFPAAAEAFCAGMQEILPWRRLGLRAMPDIAGRVLSHSAGLNVPAAGGAGEWIMEFLSPVDISGVRGPAGRSLLSRALRRVNGLARWHGAMLSPETTRALTNGIDALSLDERGLRPGRYLSPNRHGQKRAHQTRAGYLRIGGNPGPLLAVLAAAERCHVGRATVEGLGRFRLRPLPAHDSGTAGS